MKRRARTYYTEADKALMWDRWQQGESLHTIARLFDRYHNSIRRILAESGGIRLHQIRLSGSEIQRFQHRIRHLCMRTWRYLDPGLAPDGRWRPCTTGNIPGKAVAGAPNTPR